MRGTMNMRERGSTLIIAVLFLLVFLGMSVALVTIGVGTERDVRATVFTNRAFYLAEAGLNASLHEFGLGVDAGNDGLGKISKSVSGGTYQTVVTALPNSEYQVVSTGTFGGFTAQVASTISSTFTGAAPMGPFGISQEVTDPLQLKEKLKNNDLRIDGGTLPAVIIQEKATYDAVLADIADAIDKKLLSPTNFTGSPLVPVQTSGSVVQLPFMQVPNPLIDGELMEEVRLQITDNVTNTILPYANRTITDPKKIVSPAVWGTAATPEITYLNGDMKLPNGTNISGYGTLIVSGKSLSVTDNSSLDWHGDIYVLPTVGAAKFLVNGGSVNVTGNVVCTENGKGQSCFEIHKAINVATSSITGNLWILNGPLGKEEGLKVDGGSKFTVNGLVMMSGEKTRLITAKDGSEFIVNGSLQIAALPRIKKDGTVRDIKLDFNVSSKAWFTWNTQLVNDALQSLSKLIKDRNFTVGNQLSGYTAKAWRQVQ
jgi:hypothetical protein